MDVMSTKRDMSTPALAGRMRTLQARIEDTVSNDAQHFSDYLQQLNVELRTAATHGEPQRAESTALQRMAGRYPYLTVAMLTALEARLGRTVPPEGWLVYEATRPSYAAKQASATDDERRVADELDDTLITAERNMATLFGQHECKPTRPYQMKDALQARQWSFTPQTSLSTIISPDERWNAATFLYEFGTSQQRKEAEAVYMEMVQALISNDARNNPQLRDEWLSEVGMHLHQYDPLRGNWEQWLRGSIKKHAVKGLGSGQRTDTHTVSMNSSPQMERYVDSIAPKEESSETVVLEHEEQTRARELVDTILAQLPPDRAAALRQTYGIDAPGTYTLEEHTGEDVARELNILAERTRAAIDEARNTLVGRIGRELSKRIQTATSDEDAVVETYQQIARTQPIDPYILVDIFPEIAGTLGVDVAPHHRERLISAADELVTGTRQIGATPTREHIGQTFSI